MTEAELRTSETVDLADREEELPALDWLDYVIYVPFFFVFLGTLIFYDILFRVAGRSHAAREKIAASLNRAVVRSLKLVGVSVHYEGIPELPDDRPYLIVSNHQSMFDISILHGAFAKHRPKFVAKVELSRGIPGVSICLRTEGSALIDRSNPRQAIPAIKDLGKRMEEGNFASILFPEGTRARRGKLKPFKTGGILNVLSTSPRTEIIPVALDGSWKIAGRKFGPIPRGIKVEVKADEVIKRSGNDKETAAKAEPEIRRLLGELRAPKAEA